MRRHVSSAVFFIVIFSLVLPWIEISAGCTGVRAAVGGVELLGDTEAQFSKQAEGQRTEYGSLPVQSQTLVQIAGLLAVLGLALWLLKREAWAQPPYLIATGVAVTGAAAVVAFGLTVQDLELGAIQVGEELKEVEPDIGAGALLALYGFIFAALLNLVVLWRFPMASMVARGRSGRPALDAVDTTAAAPSSTPRGTAAAATSTAGELNEGSYSRLAFALSCFGLAIFALVLMVALIWLISAVTN